MRQTLKLGASPESARRARDVVRDTLAAQPLGSRVLDTALLLTSELVVNATVHGEGEVITLDVDLHDHVLRVSVTDAGSGEPAAQHGERFDEGGRGLAMVEDLAT